MARYTGPRTKIARKFGEPIYGSDKYFEKKNYPPGMHGANSRRKKVSEYGTQLKEKQKAKYTYGVLERQFRKTFEHARRGRRHWSHPDATFGITPRQCGVPYGHRSYSCRCPSAREPSSYRRQWQRPQHPFILSEGR